MGLFSKSYENLARQFALDLGLPADISHDKIMLRMGREASILQRSNRY